MLKFIIEIMLRARNIKEGYKFFKENGFSQRTATKFRNSSMTVMRLVHLEKVCELLHCTPNDLLEWQPKAGEKNIEKHPLFPLKKKEAIAKVSESMSTLSIEELGKLEKIIADLKAKKI